MTTAMTATIYHCDGRERTLNVLEAAREVHAGGGWSTVKPPPPGWERETPQYRVTRELKPAEKARFRLEPPFAHSFDSNVWQYGERPLKAGEILETTAWPHPSFHPLNFAAQKVLAFFNAAMKSRLPLAPFYGGQVRLDDGLTGSIVVSVVPPQLQPVDLRPVS
jgi:hypothetical protein